MRRFWTLTLCGLVPAIVVASTVFLIGIISRPPKFTARGTFTIDWKTMPSVPDDETAEKVRKNWRKSIISNVTSLPRSDDEISEVLGNLDGLNDDQVDKADLIAKLRGCLRLKLASQDVDSDRFVVEVSDDDPKWAAAVANQVLHGTVSKLKTQATPASGVAALRSNANVEEVIQKKSDLHEELRKLEETYSRPFPDDVEQRYEAIKEELNQLEFKHFEAGLGFLANLAGVFYNDSIKVTEEAQVEKRGRGYGWLIVLAALGSGCIAGATGILLQRRLSAPRRAKKSTGNKPPLISHKEVQRPPPLLHAPPVLHTSPPPLPDPPYRKP